MTYFRHAVNTILHLLSHSNADFDLFISNYKLTQFWNVWEKISNFEEKQWSKEMSKAKILIIYTYELFL